MADQQTSSPRYMAQFTPQAWLNDHAMPVDPQGETVWDCTQYLNKEVDQAEFSDAIMKHGEWLDRNDVLKGDPNAPQWVRDWTGPFSIVVKPATAIFNCECDSTHLANNTVCEDCHDAMEAIADDLRAQGLKRLYIAVMPQDGDQNYHLEVETEPKATIGAVLNCDTHRLEWARHYANVLDRMLTERGIRVCKTREEWENEGDVDDDSNPSVGTPTADSIGVHDGVTEKPEPAFHVLNDHQVLYFTGGDGSDYLSHKDLPAMRTPMQANQYICIANNLSLPLVLIDATPLDDPKVAQFARQVCEALNRFGGESHDPETLSQLLAYDDDTTPDQLRANIDHVRGLLDKMVDVQSRREYEALLRIGAQHPAWSSNPDDKLVRIFNSVTAVAREAVNAQGNDDDQKADWCGAQMGDEVARLAHVQRGINDATGVVEHQYVYGDTDTYGFTIDVFQGGGDRYQARSWENGDTTDISYHPSVAKALEWIVEQLIEDAEGEESPNDEIHKGGFSHEENTPYDTPASHLLAAMNKQKSGDDDDAPIIHVEDGESACGLGYISPPAHLLADTRSQDGEPFWQVVLLDLYNQWMESDPEHNVNFVDWLVCQQGWSRREPSIISVVV